MPHPTPAYYQALFEHAPDGIVIADADGRCLDANPSICRMLQYTREEMIGLAPTEMVAATERAEIAAALEAVRAGSGYRREWQLRRKDGSELPAQIVVTATPDGALLASVRDITRRKSRERELTRLRRLQEEEQRRLAEAALQKSESLYRSLFDNMLNGFALCRMHFQDGQPVDFTYLEVNAAFAKLTGLKNVQGRKATEVIPGLRERDPALLEAYGRVARSGTPERLELYVEALQMWFEIAIYSPKQDHFVAVFDVVTERKRQEEALRLSEEQFRALFELASIGMAQADAETGRFLRVNQKMQVITGYTVEELLRMRFTELTHPDDRAADWEDFQRIVRGEAAEYRAEKRRLRKDGSIAWVNVNVVIVRDAAGRPLSSMAAIEDITARKEAENVLREREEQLHLYAEHSPAAIAMLDRDMRYLVVSRRWMEDFRLGEESIIGRSHYEIFPDVPVRWVEAHRRCLAGGIEKCEEDFFPRADGTINWSRWEIRPWRRADGLIGGIIIFSEEITERKQTEEALKERMELQNQLAQVAATVPGMIYSFHLRPDGSMCMPYASPAVQFIFGLEPGQVREDWGPARALIHPDDLGRLEETIAESARTMQPWREEFRMRLTRRGERWMEGHSVPQREPDGGILWHGFIQDITERKQKTDELQWKTALMEAQVDSALDGILVVDSGARKILQNEQLLKLFKVPAAIANDTDDSKLLRHVANQTKNPQEFAERAGHLYAHPDEIGRDEIELIDGTILDRYSSAVRDKAGKYYGRIWTFRDISHGRQLELQLRQAQKLEGIGQLAGGVAHDFNNMLAAIIMQTELTEQAENLSEAAREGLHEIRSAADRAANLTRQLLLFSRKQVMQPRDLDLNDVVTNLAKMLQRIIGEDLRLHLHLHPKPLSTFADPGMIDQVLMNLTVNARDAMPEGGRLTIETADKIVDATHALIHPDAAPGRYVTLMVTDEGIGIPPEVLPRIFEPFFTTKDAGKGTGLGLATVFGIVKQHQGWIEVKSEAGHGAAFHIHLPASRPKADAPVEAAPKPKPQGGKETILVVEDESLVRAVTRILLVRNGYRVIEAANGVEALKIWQEQGASVALLLTDLVMPGGVSGQQLARELQSAAPNLKVIYTSGYSPEIAGRALALRTGENFLQKPFPADQLLEAIRRSLDA